MDKCFLIGLGCRDGQILFYLPFADVRRIDPGVIFVTSGLYVRFHPTNGFLQSHPSKPERGVEQDN